MTAAPSVTPSRIVDIAIGFMSAKQLFAASRIGLFRALADGPLSSGELAVATGRSAHQVRILADAMLAQGLLERAEGGYALADDAAAYLSGTGDVDLTPFLAFLNDISYPQWLGYDKTVDTDEAGTLDLDAEGWAHFLDGVMSYNALHAEQLATVLDFTRFRSALDIDGISPRFAIGALEANPELRAVLAVAADSHSQVADAVVAAGVADRATVVAADAELPGGNDLVMLNHVLHRYGRDENRHFIALARAAAAPGATLVALDFYLDDDGEQRALDAIHAGEYYNIDGTVVYPLGEVEGWLADAGWSVTEILDVPGSPRVILAEAV
ncbi:MAG: methyltransferase dimerization domain-containing protein [Microbacterium sp.]